MDEKKSESTKELQKAIEILEKFSRDRENSSTFSLLKKTISFAKQLFSPTHLDEQKSIHQAMDIIKKNTSFIQSLAKGTPQQKEWVSAAYSIIHRFNQLGTFFKKPPLSWRRWMGHLPIDIPNDLAEIKKETSYKFHHLDEDKDRFSLPSLIEKKSSTVSEDPIAPSTQEIDAFRMKAITLLKHHEVRFTSIAEQLKIIREVPILLIDPPPYAKSISHSIITMQQTLSPLPGETIELKGAFKRHHSQSIPIPESFHLASRSAQTGFPHPSQYTGWSLCPQIVSEDLWVHKMQKMAKQLMPEGSLNKKAKHLLTAKHQTFNTHSQLFLNLHHQLNQRILKKAQFPENPTLDTFYAILKTEKNVYDVLSRTHEIIVSKVWDSPTTHEESLFSHEIGAFIDLMVDVYKKLLLTHKDLLVQASLKQVQSFMEELDNSVDLSIEDMKHRFIQLLEEDLKLWE